jgi:hypothetical protein
MIWLSVLIAFNILLIGRLAHIYFKDIYPNVRH